MPLVPRDVSKTLATVILPFVGLCNWDESVFWFSICTAGLFHRQSRSELELVTAAVVVPSQRSAAAAALVRCFCN